MAACKSLRNASAPTCGGQCQLGIHDVAEQPLLPMLCLLPMLSLMLPRGRRLLHAVAAQVDHLQLRGKERDRARSSVSDHMQPFCTASWRPI